MNVIKQTLQRGISLLEVMLSLSIIAVILVMATRYYETAHRSNELNKVTEQIGAIEAAINQYKTNNGNTVGFTIAQAVLDGYYAKSSDYQGTDLFSPYGKFTFTIGGTDSSFVTVGMPVPAGNTGTTLCQQLLGRYPSATCETGKTFSLNVPSHPTPS